jgi:chemotaxis protein histidine kinase CheA
MWQDAQEQQQDDGQQQDAEMEEAYAEYVAVRLNGVDDLFNLMCAMNQARLEEIERDMEPHKRSGYGERMAEQADMQRKAKRENGE